MLTSWAITKAITKSIPGRSTKDQLRERVTNIRAWLTILTCKYKADIISSWVRCLTPNFSCKNSQGGVICLIQEKELNLFQLNNSYREEISFSHYLEKYDSHQCQVTPKHNPSSKYFLQFPAIRQGRWLHSVLGNCHDCS